MVVSRGTYWFMQKAKPTNYSLICTLVLSLWVINVLSLVTEVGHWLQPFLFSQRFKIAPVFRVEVNRRPSDLSYTVITPSAASLTAECVCLHMTQI